MRRIFFIMVFLTIVLCVKAQLSTHELPYSFNNGKQLRNDIDTKIMPALDMAKINKEDEEYKRHERPYRFGYSHKVNYNLSNSGTWQTLSNGDKIWRMNIECPNALSINLLYDKFWIPEGGKLFLYTNDKKQSIGAFTNKNNKGDNINFRGFATELLFSEKITIEYYQPKEVIDDAVISICCVVHGYRSINTNEIPVRSGGCQVNINCSEGQNWQKEKKAIALIVIGNGHGTGSLINTTSDDESHPYFLTANHLLCDVYNNDGNHDALSSPNLDQWLFYWNYEDPGCVNVNTPLNNNSTQGATILANNSVSDFALLLLDDDPRQISGFYPYYLGWDATGNAGGNGVCIHHPGGDVKKISTVATNPISTDCMSNYQTNNGNYWKIIWANTINGFGTTEGGSSGSPLLNSSHHIVGQLYGGWSNCSYYYDNNGTQHGPTLPDWFGKFNVSWTGNGNNDIHRRLDWWLNPSSSGTLTMDGSYNWVINGSDFVCDSAVYYVENLPQDYSVEWDYPIYSDPKPRIITDYPSANSCMIVNRYKYPSEDTLTAIVKYNDEIQQVIKKKVIAEHNGFSGTYYQQPCYYYNVLHPEISERPLSTHTPIFVHMGCTVVLKSEMFKTRPVSYSGATPAMWSVDKAMGRVYFQLPLGTGGIPFSIKLGECFNKGFLFFAIGNNGNMSSSNTLVITPNGGIYDIAILETIEGNSNIPNEYHDDYLRQKDQNNYKSSITEGLVEIYSGQTGRKMTTGKLTDNHYSLNCTGWPSGFYVVRVVRGNEVFAEKMQIK